MTMFTTTTSQIKFLPCSDHHQVVEKARAHFLFLHLGLTTSRMSRHPGSMFPLESVVPFHHNWEVSGVKFKLISLINHCGGSKNDKPATKEKDDEKILF